MTDLLLIEDNLEFAQLLKALLFEKGFSLFSAKSGEEALEWLKTYTPKLVILDIMLPNIDGFVVCETIRKTLNIPIIILSARGEKPDQLLGFELGADDYMEKPVDFDILMAKIKVLLGQHINQSVDQIQTGALLIDLRAHRVYYRGILIDLGSKEFELLLLFVRNPGKTLHKHYIFNQIWKNSDSEDQTLTVHIRMLRSKIEDDPKNPQRIETVWGVGYRYEEI